MSNVIELKLLSENSKILQDLSSSGKRQSVGNDKIVFQCGQTRHVPGIVDSWYELVTTVGLATVPASILAGVVTNWLTNSINKENNKKVKVGEQRRSTIKLILRSHGRSSEVTIETDNLESVEKLILTAIENVHHD